MARSLKKGPFVNYKLEKRVLENTEKKSCIKNMVKSFNDNA